MFDRATKVESFIRFLANQAPKVKVTHRQPVDLEKKRANDAYRGRKSRLCKKLELAPTILDLPLDILFAGWLAEKGLPENTPHDLLPLEDVKTALVADLMIAARRKLLKKV